MLVNGFLLYLNVGELQSYSRCDSGDLCAHTHEIPQITGILHLDNFVYSVNIIEIIIGMINSCLVSQNI